MKLKWICLLLLMAFLLMNLSCVALVILETANAVDVPSAIVYAYLLTFIVICVVFFILIKKPGFREVADSSKWIQGLAYANVICALLMMVISGVLKCI